MGSKVIFLFIIIAFFTVDEKSEEEAGAIARRQSFSRTELTAVIDSLVSPLVIEQESPETESGLTSRSMPGKEILVIFFFLATYSPLTFTF